MTKTQHLERQWAEAQMAYWTFFTRVELARAWQLTDWAIRNITYLVDTTSVVESSQGVAASGWCATF